jgi:uncharacterized protein (DUF4415 family)
VARKEVGGVRGVLGDLISTSSTEKSNDSDSLPVQCKRSTTISPSVEQPEPRRVPARLGRPAGRQSGQVPPKEKITVRIDARLAAVYREWSWDQRCQLGELIERALRAYRRSKV